MKDISHTSDDGSSRGRDGRRFPVVRKDISHLSDDELDALLLAQVEPGWQKVASMIAKVIVGCETWSEGDDGRVGDRVAALVNAGKLESAGNIRKWRFSEVRLPTG